MAVEGTGERPVYVPTPPHTHTYPPTHPHTHPTHTHTDPLIHTPPTQTHIPTHSSIPPHTHAHTHPLIHPHTPTYTHIHTQWGVVLKTDGLGPKTEVVDPVSLSGPWLHVWNSTSNVKSLELTEREIGELHSMRIGGVRRNESQKDWKEKRRGKRNDRRK